MFTPYTDVGATVRDSRCVQSSLSEESISQLPTRTQGSRLYFTCRQETSRQRGAASDTLLPRRVHGSSSDTASCETRTQRDCDTQFEDFHYIKNRVNRLSGPALALPAGVPQDCLLTSLRLFEGDNILSVFVVGSQCLMPHAPKQLNLFGNLGLDP
ncbi:hypothetical protein WJX82_005866 [Trebouxia sp. C0006]